MNQRHAPLCRPDEHSWVVYATDLRHGVLRCRCTVCAAMGRILEPSSQEWEEAFYARHKPYPWPHNERVTTQRAL